MLELIVDLFNLHNLANSYLFEFSSFKLAIAWIAVIVHCTYVPFIVIQIYFLIPLNKSINKAVANEPMIYKYVYHIS